MSFKDNYPLTPPTLSLDFINSAAVDPRVTFSRSSKATYYNPAGLLTVAGVNVPRIDYDPITHECRGLLIEESRTNLVTYSEQFDNAAWTKSNSSVLTNLLTYSQEFDNAVWIKTTATLTANVTTAPDGTTTADNLTATGADSAVRQQNISATAGQSYVFSVYLRADTPTTLGIFIVDGGGGAGNTQQVVNVTTSWQRFTVTRTLSAGTTVISAQIGGANSFSTGESVYCWGAQLVQGTNPEEYTVTTSAPAPIQVMGPLGFLGAEKLVESAVNTIHYTYQGATTSANTSHTLSVYCKAAERTQVDVRVGGLGWAVPASTIINLSNGSVISGSGTVVSVGSGWYRISITGVTDGTIVSRGILIAPASGGTATYTGDGTSGIYIFGAQLEAGSFPTSYIPTTAASVTRAADNASMTGTNFSSWYNQSAGTVAVEYDRLSNITASGYPRVYSITDGTLLNEIDALQQTGSGEYFSIYTNGTNQALIPNIVVTAGNSIKTASSYATNNVNSATNTILGVNDNLATIPPVTRLDFGNRFDGLRPLNGHIKSIKYYPIRLTNAQLQTLTNP